MSDFFLHENILIRYWIDRCQQYNLYGIKIKKAVANIPLSITPDISMNIFEDGKKIPCEIKWTTSGFNDPEQIRHVQSLNGFLLVFDKDREDCPIPQIEIDKKDFERWFVKNSKKLADDTIQRYSRSEKKRIDPKVFLNYLSTSKKGKRNWEIAMSHKTWGMNNNDFNRSSKEILNIRKGDIIIFFHAWTKKKDLEDVRGGRVPIEKFIGNYKYIYALIVTHDYYNSLNPKLWDDKDYPHRFKFRILFEGNDIRCDRRNLGAPLHTICHQLLTSPRFLPVDSSILLKTLSLCTK